MRHLRFSHRYICVMAKWKQYELWVQTGESKWDMIGVFPSTDMATAVAKARSRRARIIEAIYEGNKLLEQEVVVELGIRAGD